jgi:predicted DCC family thiol-disulfide oxidoreductase YuxK
MQGIDHLRNLWPILAAILLWMLVAVLLRYAGIRWIERPLRIVAAFLARRRLFRVPIRADAQKLNLLRIALGVAFLDRTLNIAQFVYFGPDDPIAVATCALVTLLAVMFTFGFLTPIASIALLFCNTLLFDNYFRTYTLGSDVLAILLIVFALLPAGTQLSIDRWILDGKGALSGTVGRLYALVGAPTFCRAVLAKAACMLSYGLLCLYSALAHLHDPAWLTGNAAPLLLTSSYLTPHFDLFRSLFESSPLAVKLFRFSMYVMFVWYLGFIVFSVIGGILRKFVIIWSLLFFGLSTFALDLGWLGIYEFILLATLFWDRAFLNHAGARTLLILYDDRCNLCDRTMRVIRTIDLFAIARFRPLSKNIAMAASHGIDQAQAMTDLYAIDARRSRNYAGYDFYLEVAKRVFLALPFYPFLLLGRLIWIGPAAYRYIADRRTRLFGVCQLPTDPGRLESRRWPAAIVKATRTPAGRALFNSYVLLHVVFAGLYLTSLPGIGSKLGHFLRTMTHVNGYMRIDVFNSHDLTLSEHWFTIAADYGDGRVMLLPFVGAEGERLAWHKSDRVYFGNSLLWRRSKNEQPGVCWDDGDVDFLREIVEWHKYRSDTPAKGYVLTYYFEPLPSLSVGPFQYPAIEPVCTRMLDASLNPVKP